MSYVLVYKTSHKTESAFFGHYQTIRNLRYWRAADSADELIMYLIYSNDLFYLDFVILEAKDFIEQRKRFQDGLHIEKYIKLVKNFGKYKVVNNCIKLSWSLDYIKEYNKYVDMDKKDIYKIYKEEKGRGFYYFTFKSTMIKYILDRKFEL